MDAIVNEDLIPQKEDDAIISLKNVSVCQYGTYILKNVNLSINKGEFVYLIGKSGTGKTSLLRSLYVDFPIAEGEGEVCGISLGKIKRKNISLLRRKIGIIFQSFQLLTDRDVYNNLYFVLRATGWKDKTAIEERIVKSLESVYLADKIRKPIYQLSEGEQQRVGIARALVNEPELILADEPTGNLDPITSEEIMKLLKIINEEKKTTIVIATHDYITLDKFRSRIVYFENGTIM